MTEPARRRRHVDDHAAAGADEVGYGVAGDVGGISDHLLDRCPVPDVADTRLQPGKRLNRAVQGLFVDVAGVDAGARARNARAISKPIPDAPAVTRTFAAI
jgi:hypothetical protein